MDNSHVNLESDFSKKLEKLSTGNKHTSYYFDWIDNMELDVKYKNILKKVLEVSGKVCGVLYSVGKIALDVLIKIVSTFPNTAIGVVVGYTLGSIIALIPFVGPAIATVTAPILALIGGAAGFLMDASNQMLKWQISKEISKHF